MPLKYCLGWAGETCRILSPGSRCPRHEAMRTKARNARPRPPGRRPGYGWAERQRRAAAVAAHRAQHGDVCPGWRRPPHPATDLTADHVKSVAAGGAESGQLAVLCRPCNGRKGAHG